MTIRRKPVTGKPRKRVLDFEREASDHSAELVCIDPQLGYVPATLRVASKRAADLMDGRTPEQFILETQQIIRFFTEETRAKFLTEVPEDIGPIASRLVENMQDFSPGSFERAVHKAMRSRPERAHREEPR